jgi:hypothetical protein
MQRSILMLMSLPFACAIAMEKHGLRLKAE